MPPLRSELFEYLVFSQGMYGRFYNEPEIYSSEVSQYDGFFSRFGLVKMFTDGDYEIRNYKVEKVPDPLKSYLTYK